MRGKWPHGKEKGAETSHGWEWINLPRVVHRLFSRLFKSIIILVCFNVLLELSIKTNEEKFHEQCDGDWFIPTSFPSCFMYRHGMCVVLIVEARMIQVYADVYSGDFLLVKSSVFFFFSLNRNLQTKFDWTERWLAKIQVATKSRISKFKRRKSLYDSSRDLRAGLSFPICI